MVKGQSFKKRFRITAETIIFPVIILSAIFFIIPGCKKKLPDLKVIRGNKIVAAESGFATPFKIVLDTDPSYYVKAEAISFRDQIYKETGVYVDIVETYEAQENLKYKIFFNANGYYETSQILFELKDNEYEISIGERNGVTYIAVCWRTGGIFGVKEAISEHLKDNKFSFTKGENIKGETDPMKSIITTNVPLRDPFVLLDNGIYYCYGTGWKVYKNTTGDISGEWTGGAKCVTVPDDAIDNYWAPEVYKLESLGGYYMFTTYLSAETGHRGCAVFKADDPEGPFVMISDGHVTPKDRDSIDGHLYIDKSGDPYMVFVNEWTSAADNIGRMSVAKMSTDLTRLVSEPVDVFSGTDAPWATGNITDGPFVYELSTGKLLMLWSNFDEFGYACGMAISKSGDIYGPWEQIQNPLFSKTFTGKNDGGHGMIFKTSEGKLYLSIHSPNTKTAKNPTLAIFVPVIEVSGILSADIR